MGLRVEGFTFPAKKHRSTKSSMTASRSYGKQNSTFLKSCGVNLLYRMVFTCDVKALV